MKDSAGRQPIFRSDYSAPAYLVSEASLVFEIDAAATEVRAVLAMHRNPESSATAPLWLDGVDLELLGIRMDGQALDEAQYTLDSRGLRIDEPPEQFLLETRVRIHPERNTALEGLYQSGHFLLTQCEAEGFRKITYFPDRPDVMTRFRVTIQADRERYPVLLSNGNLTSAGESPDGRHWVRWDDPFPKPTYLFALVAGDLAHVRDRFVTQSGREVDLHIYVERDNLDRCEHAMNSLKAAMRWDEERFGLEYDLDVYNIVATNDFNMGAMENKSLNIFNSKYVLARPETATDRDYQGIEGVIGHEYFHNWTGNRVTCRDWFQLTLKEGLTVYRDQEFSSDMQSRAVKRIQDVRNLRRLQFAEDAGPMAHAIRPDQYIEINNFYTVTVYEKGAEVVRMYETLLGRDGFRRGLDKYFERHDGEAVTCQDFLAAMQDANDTNLEQFGRWYSQPGTPQVHVTSHYNADQQSLKLEITQSNPQAGEEAEPLLIPLAIGLIRPNGDPLPLRLAGGGKPRDTLVLKLREASQQYEFEQVPEAPVLSLLRNFSAPVTVHYNYPREQLAILMAHDTDEFARWEAASRLCMQVLLEMVEQKRSGKDMQVDPILIEAFRESLGQANAEPAMLAELLQLPAETYVADQMAVIDVDGIHQARNSLRHQLGTALNSLWASWYQRLARDGAPGHAPADMGRRSLRNLCLGYLAASGEEGLQLAHQQWQDSDNMTDTLAALTILVHEQADTAAAALVEFENQWRHDALVMDKWFIIQATSPQADALDQVRELVAHPGFRLTNPNKVRAVVGTFAQTNPYAFNRADGAGYRWVADQVLALDPLNPQVAARLALAFNRWRRLDSARSEAMREQLMRIRDSENLSPDVFEIVTNALR